MEPLTPDQEAMYSRLIYFSFGCVGIITLLAIALLEWIRREKKRQFDRKDFILDRLSHSAREVNIIIEEIWQRNQEEK